METAGGAGAGGAESGPHGAEETMESVSSSCPAATDQDSLLLALENTLTFSKEKNISGESPGQEDVNGKKDGQTICPSTAEASNSEPKWEVGARCRAVWSEDGQVYTATVMCLDGGRCRVRFSGYDNEEDVELSALLRPKEAPPTSSQTSQDWCPGSRCRAAYAKDGMFYPAVILWVRGQRCRVRFDKYNNEEELDVGSLLTVDELRGPSRGRCKNFGSENANVQARRGRRAESQVERGGGAERRATPREDQQSFSLVKDKSTNQSSADREADDNRRGNQPGQEATHQSFPFFPPFPPPSQSSSGEPQSFVPPSPLPPPPPPLLVSTDSTSTMLMMWYTCGFYTGSYMTQQQLKSSTKE